MNPQLTPNREINASRLQDAMLEFNLASRDLAESYRDLETRAERLVDELADAKDARIRELKAKERLAQRLRGLLDALPGGVVVLDGGGRVSECNPAAECLLQTRLLGRLWAEVVREVFAPQPDDGHEVSLRTGTLVNVATRSLGDEPGQILLIKDVTETRKLQDRVARMERLSAMGKMVASLAHQLRTPLATALLLASNLAGIKGPHANVQRRIVGRLRKLENLVNDMLGFANRGRLVIDVVSAAEFFTDFAASAAAVVEAHGARFSFRSDVPDAHAAIAANSEALSSALLNLVGNALEHGGNTVHVQAAVSQINNDVVRVVVSDDGPGIPSRDVPRIFEPFFTTRANGTGLGLAVLRSIVEAHQGQVRYRPNDGPGSLFEIDIPLAK